MPQRVLLALLSLQALLVCSCRHTPAVTLAKRDTLLFVMAGQSNMAGRGMVEPMDSVTNPRVLEMDDEQQFELKKEPNTLYQGGLAGLDCGLSFGNALLTNLPAEKTVGLIQCSVSSTSIQEWIGDSVRVLRLYSNLIARARAGLRTGKLKGVLWMQGESDADFREAALHYQQNLSLFIQKFRQDIGIPDLPFYIGLLPAWCNKPYRTNIDSAIVSTAQSLSQVFIVPTDDLSHRADFLHLDANGQRELGRRFAQKALEHIGE